MQGSGFISRFTKSFLTAQASWSARVQMVLTGAILLGVLYWVYLLLTMPFYVRQMKDSVPSVALNAMQSLPTLDDLTSYQDIVAKHPIFGVVRQTQSGPVRSACDEFKTKYMLAGIVGGAENEALFNSKSGKQTYFAKSGETLEGVTVKSVGAHSVMLNCAGQEVEMVIEET